MKKITELTLEYHDILLNLVSEVKKNFSVQETPLESTVKNLILILDKNQNTITFKNKIKSAKFDREIDFNINENTIIFNNLSQLLKIGDYYLILANEIVFTSLDIYQNFGKYIFDYLFDNLETYKKIILQIITVLTKGPTKENYEKVLQIEVNDYITKPKWWENILNDDFMENFGKYHLINVSFHNNFEILNNKNLLKEFLKTLHETKPISSKFFISSSQSLIENLPQKEKLTTEEFLKEKQSYYFKKVITSGKIYEIEIPDVNANQNLNFKTLNKITSGKTFEIKILQEIKTEQNLDNRFLSFLVSAKKYSIKAN